jgi:hypothetical protein
MLKLDEEKKRFIDATGNPLRQKFLLVLWKSDRELTLYKICQRAGLGRSSVEKFDPKMKRGSTLLIEWLDERKIPYDRDKVKVWDAIIDLRNASFPYHPTNRKLIKLVQFFGQSFPINYVEFYESVLKMFLESLEMLQRILFNACLRREGTR